jgi:carboxypeptidase Taq
MTSSTAYRSLVSELTRIDRLGSIFGLLGWDEQVNLPPASAPRRAEELAALSDIIHREFTRRKIGNRLDVLEGELDGLSAPERAVVRETRRQYDRARKIPTSFVKRKTALASKSFHAWVEAREKSEFSIFEPHLKTQLELAIEEAGYVGHTGESAYDYHIDQHDPGLSAEAILPLFSRLGDATAKLLKQIDSGPPQPETSIFKGFPEALQERFLREVTAAIGFDYSRGRIDRAVHPFCSGNGADTRMTTRFDADNPLDSLFSSIHETGHGLYEQGLPDEHHGTARGTAAGMAVHESQSRLWENQVGRSRPFWDFWEDRFREVFPSQLQAISSRELYLAINAVRPTLIRVDSDEVTYNLHDNLPGLDDDIRAGRFEPLLAWLREHVHAEGRQYNALEITSQVTGAELSPDSLIRYLGERYLPLHAG